MIQKARGGIKKPSLPRGRPVNFSKRKQEVLRAAARLFSELGFRQATLEDVAAALHITRPALYHYATSKDELATLCSDIAEASIAEAISDALRHSTGRERLVAFFRRYAEIICDDFGRCFVLVRRLEYSPAHQERNRLAQRKVDQAIRQMVSTGGTDGSLRTLNPASVSHALFAAFNGIPVWYRPTLGRTPSQIADDFMHMFMAGLTPQTPP
jgi:TetR/AcrR family transcriptional regulator, cholesterol catabolism regulator